MIEADIASPSLHDLRIKTGKTLEEVATELKLKLGEASRSHVSIFWIERRGIEKSSVLAALAGIYGVDRTEIEEAATVTKNNFNK